MQANLTQEKQKKSTLIARILEALGNFPSWLRQVPSRVWKDSAASRLWDSFLTFIGLRKPKVQQANVEKGSPATLKKEESLKPVNKAVSIPIDHHKSVALTAADAERLGIKNKTDIFIVGDGNDDDFGADEEEEEAIRVDVTVTPVPKNTANLNTQDAKAVVKSKDNDQSVVVSGAQASFFHHDSDDEDDPTLAAETAEVLKEMTSEEIEAAAKAGPLSDEEFEESVREITSLNA